MLPVHPRACGEYAGDVGAAPPLTGSSPRVRGIRRPADEQCIRNRFIPARAGNTLLSKVRAKWRTVHPRACGEYWRGTDMSRKMTGSSPRVRGIHHCCCRHCIHARFIPARAGNTGDGRLRGRWCAVHPRACGEYSTKIGGDGESHGSSPRVRGILITARDTTRTRRFIPARAGNTSVMYARCHKIPVHPRACGEYMERLTSGDHDGGSSPRVRGILGGDDTG